MLSKAEARLIAHDIGSMQLEANNPVSNSGYYLLSRANAENDVSLEAYVCVSIDEDKGHKYFSLYHYAEKVGYDNIVQPDYGFTKGCTQKELTDAVYKLVTETYSRENLIRMYEEFVKEQDEMDR